MGARICWVWATTSRYWGENKTSPCADVSAQKTYPPISVPSGKTGSQSKLVQRDNLRQQRKRKSMPHNSVSPPTNRPKRPPIAPPSTTRGSTEPRTIRPPKSIVKPPIELRLLSTTMCWVRNTCAAVSTGVRFADVGAEYGLCRQVSSGARLARHFATIHDLRGRRVSLQTDPEQDFGRCDLAKPRLGHKERAYPKPGRPRVPQQSFFSS